jgi:hypothetical protein
MTTNKALVMHLRKIAPLNRGVSEIYIEKAADEIERLERELAALRLEFARLNGEIPYGN